MNFMEVETKYNADDISASSLVSAISRVYGPGRLETIQSPDHYFTLKRGESDKFIRYREGYPRPQLTMKEKTADTNSFRRIECNLDLSTSTAPATVHKFIEMLGYFRHNFSIHKDATILWYDTFNVVHYSVYDLTPEAAPGKKLGDFIEIEMSESYAWPSEEAAWEKLTEIERTLAPLGITPKHRLRKNLFEMFRKD